MELMLRIPEDEGIELEFRNDIVSEQPEQSDIDRDLAIYDTYSHH